MFEIFKKEIKVSDRVKLYLTIGKELEAEVMEIGDNHVLVKTFDGVQTRLFDKLIGGWDLIASIKQEENIEQKKKDEIPHEPISFSHSNKPTGLKILGKIDLDKIESKRKSKIPSITTIKQSSADDSKDDFEVSGTFKSFQELKESLNARENEKLVPANAIIVRQNSQREFGFLRVPDGSEFFFGYNDIVDEDLVGKLHTGSQYVEIQVTFSITRNYKGYKATAIHLPWKVSKCHEIAHKKFSINRIEDSVHLCNQILTAFPNNYLASELLKTIEHKTKKFGNKSKKIDSIYLMGKKAKDNKNYEEAIHLLQKAIEKKERLESSIKDLASCFQDIGEIDKGIMTIENHLNELPNNSSTYNFVANLYTAAKKHKIAIDYFDKLLEITTPQNQYDVLSRKAYCLIALKKYDEALDIMNKILLLKHDHPFALKWKELIIEYKESGIDKILTLSDDTDLLEYIEGTTKIISNDLTLCKYEGIPEEALVNSSFTKKDLEKLRESFKNLVNQKGTSIPTERAKWLLTEIKLIKEHQLDDEEKTNSLLSRYCIAKAQAYAINNDFEIMRTYYLELFKINKDINYLIQPLLHCLLSFSTSWDWISKSKYTKNIGQSEINAFKNIGLQEVLSKHLELKKEIRSLVDFLIESSHNNTQIFSHISQFLSKNINESKTLKTELNIDSSNADQVVRDWTYIVKSSERERRLFNAKMKQLSISKNLETTILNIDSELKEIKDYAKQNTDKRRYDEFVDIFSELKKYLAISTFDDKERICSISMSLIQNLLNEIKTRPTSYSLENLVPILINLSDCLNSSFKKVLESSKPKISVEILSDYRFVDQHNNVNIPLAIRNKKGCSPIHDIRVQLNEDQHFKVNEVLLVSSESLKGGEERIISLPLNVSNTILKQKAGSISINLEYHSREKEEANVLLDQTLALRFYSKEQFETIPNPYASIADSGPVRDRNMFFGREDYIEDISNSLLSAPANKFIDIYGQKRSGKSSLLFHLTQKLKKSNQFICIDFTLGSTAIYDSMSFFWLILEGIERYIATSEFDSTQRPIFEAPRLQELALNPSIIFYEKIKYLYKELSKYDNWKQRKLLLLIDEFTYLYSATLRNTLDPDFMKNWKAMLEKDLFSAIVIGQDVMPKFKAKFPNEFGVFEDKRLTYLGKEDAERLIEQPIWDTKNNKSRFIGKAISKILDYTSMNPYYIQIFCARLVDFMNDNRLINVTEADVIDVAKSFVDGLHALPIDKFDNLLNAGDADLEAVPQNETLEILRQIANNSRILGSCPRDSISLRSPEYDSQILDDLLKRDVVSCPNPNYYRIQVQIFNDWLLKH